MRSKLLYCMAIIISMVISSCNTESENMPSVSTNDTEISFFASVSSRATDTEFEFGDEIVVYAYTLDGATYADLYSYTFNDDLFTSTNPILYTSVINDIVQLVIHTT